MLTSVNVCFPITNGQRMVKRLFILSSSFALKAYFIMLVAIASSDAQQFSEEVLLSNQVQQLLINTNQKVDAETVAYFSKKIMTNRQYYSKDVIAKVYLLLTRVAFNQGDINKVFEYAKDGLAVNGLDKRINLALQLKLAEVYIAKKNPHKLLPLTLLAVKNSQLSTSIKYQLMALSYRGIAYAMNGKHRSALADLQQVEQGLYDSKLLKHIELLSILARAYYHLQDYQTSRTLYLKILKLSLDKQQNGKLVQTYLSLGMTYVHLQRLDDAYNAFWQSKNQAQTQQSTIHIAHANKWLGIVLVKQKQFKSAFLPFSLAIKSYQQLNLRMDLIETLIAKAKAKLESTNTIEGYQLLSEAITLLNGDNVSSDFTGFYRMVAEMYFAQQRYQVAYQWQEKHGRMLLKKLIKKTRTDTISQRLSELFIENKEATSQVNSSISAVELKELSDSSNDLANNNKLQGVIILILSFMIILLIIMTSLFLLKTKNNKLAFNNEDSEQSKRYLSTRIQTKQCYQLTFKKAKKFQYSLYIGYLVIENWQKLNFHFNKKNISEVKREIATVINTKLSDFDYVGHLNEGEYLLLFEHQSLEEVEIKVKNLMQVINTRSFADLGNFSLVVKYALKTPDFKDIDPYLFLASTIEDIDVNYVNQSRTI